MKPTPLSVSALLSSLAVTALHSASASTPTTSSADIPEAASIPAQQQTQRLPRLMQAKSYQDGLALQHYWISEKLDGVRAYWDGQRLRSRQGYPISAPLWFTQALPNIPLDGELWIGRGQFEAVSAAVRRYQPLDHEWRQIQYRLFDLPASNRSVNGSGNYRNSPNRSVKPTFER